MRFARLYSAIACAPIVMAAAFAGVASAQSVQSVAPGFCELREPDVKLPPAVIGDNAVLRFVSCAELAEWRTGDRTSFDTFGAVSIDAEALSLGETLGQALGPDAAAGMARTNLSAADIDRQLDILAAALIEGERAYLGALDHGESIRMTAEFVRFEGAAHVHMLMTATLDSQGRKIRRVLVLPYSDGDTLRYMLASLRASAAADQIAMLSTN
ncbi:MAG: hypothetical protein AAFZ06_09700 [Pseudomonadota bacterium]